MKKLSQKLLSQKIIQLRKDKGFTQSSLAEAIHVDAYTIERIENMEYIPSIIQLQNISDVLGFDITDVFVDEESLINRISLKSYNIVVVGTDYVGLSCAMALAKHNHVTSVDSSQKRVDLINSKTSPIRDAFSEKYLAEENLDLVATTDACNAYKNADYILIATPINYDSTNNSFDTSTVESTIEQILTVNKDAIIVIKSTIPVGYTNYVRDKYNSTNIIYNPEFLREPRALYDNLYPARIIVSTDITDAALTEKVRIFAQLLRNCALKEEVKVLLMGFTEAEAVKLFSNAYLALRVSYFNELDTYAETKTLNTKDIIDGVCLDPRIGTDYNNPCFGYGGFSLPKDTKQLLTHFNDIPENLIKAIVESDDTRKDFIADRILDMAKTYSKNTQDGTDPNKDLVIGVYRILIQSNKKHFPQSSIQEIIKRVKSQGAKVIIYEPGIQGFDTFEGDEVINDIDEFKRRSDCIIANRYDKALEDVDYKVYSRDVFNRK